MEARVPPWLKAFRNELFAPEAIANRLLVSAGEIGAFPTVNVFSSGEFSEKLSTTVAGNVSVKIPIPPRKTVLSLESGLQAKPMRGCQTMLSVAGYASWSPVLITWL